MEKTMRITLRELDASDATNIVEWRSRPEVYKYFKSPHAITRKEHMDWYNNYYLKDNNRFDYMLIMKETKEPLGVFGIKYLPDAESVEISYLIKRDAQGKGYAKEAVQLLISIAQEKWNCKKIVAEIHKDNVASIRFIKKQNFVLEKQHQDFILFGRNI